jgi:hypothetical protein
LPLRRDTYSGLLKIRGEGHPETVGEANNYAILLLSLKRYAEAKSLLRKTIPVARGSHGENHDDLLRTRGIYANALLNDPGATLDDLREAVKTLEEMAPIARRVLGSAHPTVRSTEMGLRVARDALRAREATRAPPPS